MRKEQTAEELPVDDRRKVSPEERPGAYYREESPGPRYPAERRTSKWHRRQRPAQRFSEQDSYNVYRRHIDEQNSPRGRRGINSSQETEPRAQSVGSRRRWRSFHNRAERRLPDDRYAYHSRRARHIRPDDTRYWDRQERFERTLAYEDMQSAGRRYRREPVDERGMRARGRPLRDDVWDRSRTRDKFVRLHDTIERLNAELIATQNQRYQLEKENSNLELDFEEFRAKSNRSIDQLREQDLALEKMSKKIMLQENKIRRLEDECAKKKQETDNLKNEVKHLKAERGNMDEKILGENTELRKERDELTENLKKTKSQLTFFRKEHAELQLVNDENRNLKFQIKRMKQQNQRKDIGQEAQNRDVGNGTFKTRKIPGRENMTGNQAFLAKQNDWGPESSIHRHLDEGKLAKPDLNEKNRLIPKENSRLTDEKILGRNFGERGKSYERFQAKSWNDAVGDHYPDYTESRGRSRTNGSPEDRAAIEEPTPRGRSPFARGSYERRNEHNPMIRQRALSVTEPPRWFSQMDRYSRDNLEQLFTKADKEYSGDADAIQCMLKNNSGLTSYQCSDIYNYFMRSEFVYRSRKWSPSSVSHYRTRSPFRTGSSLNSYLINNSAPRKYDGPLKGAGNTFWVKFRNPHLKEQIEAAEGPVLTPTQTPDTSPEPETSLEKKQKVIRFRKYIWTGNSKTRILMSDLEVNWI